MVERSAIAYLPAQANNFSPRNTTFHHSAGKRPGPKPPPRTSNHPQMNGRNEILKKNFSKKKLWKILTALLYFFSENGIFDVIFDDLADTLSI